MSATVLLLSDLISHVCHVRPFTCSSILASDRALRFRDFLFSLWSLWLRCSVILCLILDMLNSCGFVAVQLMSTAISSHARDFAITVFVNECVRYAVAAVEFEFGNMAIFVLITHVEALSVLG